MWNHNGQQRPDFAFDPGPGQESVWDYPRPPVAKSCTRCIKVRHEDMQIATSNQSYRLLETASPPTYYLPPEKVNWRYLTPVSGSSVCEWKGAARYWALLAAPDMPVAWAYPRPRARFAMLKNYVSFYPGRVACFVTGERVRPQPGHFYGGWITDDVVGPFKGEAGTGHW